MYADPHLDIAIFRPNDTIQKPMLSSNTKPLEIGEELYCVKPSKNNKYDLTAGILTKKSKVEEIIGVNIIFSEDCIGDKTNKTAENLLPGQVMLL